MAHLDAEYFSAWYADMGEVPDKDRLWSAALGLPEDVLSTSLLTGAGLDDVADLLGLGADDVLLDLACGRAGYGLELLRRSGARLVGVDFAASAIAQAVTNATCLGLRDRADFRVADMASTGLGPASVTAVLCVDAIQFPQGPEVVLAEILRVLVPGGRLVLTGWEPRHADDPSVPERLRRVDLGGWLRVAGFRDVAAHRRDDWAERECAAWRAVSSLPTSADPAVRSLQEEGRSALERSDIVRRVLATGLRPRAPAVLGQGGALSPSAGQWTTG